MNRKVEVSQRGFTLIEMMTVITIIVILAGITVAGMSYITDKQANAKAKVDIELLSSAIEKYKLDYGDYPGFAENTDPAGDISEELYNALFYDGWNYKENEAGDETDIYLKELDPRSGKQTWVAKTNSNQPPMDLKITDPWSRTYRYRKGLDAQNPDFDLWSMGKDGTSNFTNPDKSDPDNKDDIRNF